MKTLKSNLSSPVRYLCIIACCLPGCVLAAEQAASSAGGTRHAEQAASSAGGTRHAAQEKGQLPDVLIQAEGKRPLTSEKPVLNLDLKEESPLESVLRTEDEVRFKIPSDIIQSTHFVTGIARSPYVAVPSSNRIVLAWKGEPARIFYPRKELSKIYEEKQSRKAKSKAAWQMVVVDTAGKIFKKFEGQGLPPDTLIFEGRSDDGKWLSVGQVYTGVLTYRDPNGRSHTAMDRPFAVAGLSIQAPQGFVINLAARMMFNAEKGNLSAYGKSLIRETAGIIQRYHPGLNIEATAYLNRSDAQWVRSAAESCDRELSARLLLPEKAVAARSKPGTRDIEERLEVTVLNR
ncbi:MAG: hypothetical protein ABIG11_02810 [bacterium]